MDKILECKSSVVRVISHCKTTDLIFMLTVVTLCHIIFSIISEVPLHTMFLFMETIIASFIAYDVFLHRYVFPIRKWVSDCVTGVKEDLSTNAFAQIVNGWNNHRIGISLCIKTAVTCKDYMDVLVEAIKIGSFLNLEKSLISSLCSQILGKIQVTESLETTTSVPQVASTVTLTNTALDTEQIKKIVPSLATFATLIGANIADVDSTKFVNNFAKNLKNSQTILDHALNITNELGITKNSLYDKLEAFSNNIKGIEVDHQWFKDTLISNGCSLLHVKNRRRVEKYINNVEQLTQDLRTIETSKLNNAKIVQDANVILRECREFISQYEQIKNCNGLRPVPVGVCIKGQSHIGKTTLIDACLIPGIKRALYKHPKGRKLFGEEIMSWSTWNYNARDDFDSNYCSQEIVYHDDAWQKKDHSDHDMYFTWISSSVVGMNMSDNKQKGRPFKSLLILQTCNQYPVKSSTITDVTALHNRFPITVEVDRIRPQPKTFDPEFSHCKFRTAPMAEYVSNTIKKGKDAGCPINPNHGTVVSISNLINKIVDALIHNMEQYERQKGIIARIEDVSDEPSTSGIVRNTSDLEITPLATNSIQTQTLESSLDGVLDVIKNWNKNKRVPSVSIPSLQDLENFQLNHQRDIDNTINSKAIHTIDDLYRPDGTSWLQYLIKNENNEIKYFDRTLYINNYQPADENDVGNDELSQVLLELGSWKIDPQNEELFYNALAKQPSLRVQDRLGVIYWWGAPFNGFRSLIPENEQTKYMYTSNRNVNSHVIRLYLGQMEWCQGIAVNYGISLLTGGLYSVVASLRFNSLLICGLNRPFWSDHPQRRWRYLHNVVSIGNAHQYAVHSAFTNFKKLSDKFSNKLIVITLRMLEFFGLDVDNYWRDFIMRRRVLIDEVVLLSLVSTLMLLLYYLLTKLFIKKPEVTNDSKETDPKLVKIKPSGKIEPLTNRCSQGICNLNEEDEEITIEDGNSHTIKFNADCNELLKLDYEMFDPTYSSNNEDTTRILDMSLYSHGREEIYKDCILDIKCNRVTINIEKYNFQESSQRTGTIVFNSIGTYDQTQTTLRKYFELISILNLEEFKLKTRVYHQYRDGVLYYHVCIELICLTTKIQGKLVRYTRKELNIFKKHIDDINGFKEFTNNTVTTLLNDCGSNAPATLSFLVKKHTVIIAGLSPNDADNTGVVQIVWGLGHMDYIFTVAHAWSLNQLVKYAPSRELLVTQYNIGKVIFVDNLRDIAIIKCLNKLDLEEYLNKNNIKLKRDNLMSYTHTFGDLSHHLIPREDYLKNVNSSSVLFRVINQNCNGTGVVEYPGKLTYTVTSTNLETVYDILKIKTNQYQLIKNGDCGGPVVTQNREMSKFIGIVKGESVGCVYVSMITKEDLVVPKELINDTSSLCVENDAFMKLFVGGHPTDLPNGNDLEYIGQYIGTNKPVSDTSLSHWNFSPFCYEFEEQMQPAPLNPKDQRIEVSLPLNKRGEKSLLLTQNSIMCQELPSIDTIVLDNIVNQLSSEYASILKNIRKTPDDIELALNEGLNGNVNNIHCISMDLNKSAGIPWVDYNNKSKKSDYLRNDEGKISFKEDEYGIKLKNRVISKLKLANKGKNLVSISSSKLKDSVIKISAVKKGKTRIFHCIPVCKIITDATLFSNFKEAYVCAGLKLNHAIGTNPHSYSWREIRDKLKTHNNFFDIDYAEYDKRISREIQSSAYDIIRNVINENNPDIWDEARKTQKIESLETLVLDYNTCYRTKRGLKSGEYLTSVIGCIVNDIQFAYVFAKMNNDEFDITEYRKHVTIVTYGDDVIASVSDEMKDKINYFSVKKVLEEIGHKITPGNKDGIETDFVKFEDLVFLKRNFVNYCNYVLAPLSKRSIESPFVYTQIPEEDHVIWFNLINQQLDEACLWGEEYYNEFVNKLKCCTNSDLLSFCATLLAMTYENRFKKYINNYVL